MPLLTPYEFLSRSYCFFLGLLFTEDTVFLVQPPITYPTNDKKTAECSHPRGNLQIADSVKNVFLAFVEN